MECAGIAEVRALPMVRAPELMPEPERRNSTMKESLG
jgi:hypothetical protein